MMWLIVSPQSQLIHKIAYCEEARVLRIGLYGVVKRYEYHDVPPELVLDLINAEHPGAFFGEHIKGQFKTRWSIGGCIDEAIQTWDDEGENIC